MRNYGSQRGAVLFSVAGAALVAVRPADKATANEADMRRYSALMANSLHMSRDELASALETARTNDTPEIETLRDVAYNDVVEEMGRPDARVPLRWHERLIATLA